MHWATIFLLPWLGVVGNWLRLHTALMDITIWNSGVYILSVVNDPKHTTLSSMIYINGDIFQTTHRTDGGIGGFDRAIPFNAMDNISYVVSYGQMGEHTKIGVVFATDNVDHFQTYKSPVDLGYQRGMVLGFKTYLDPTHGFRTVHDPSNYLYGASVPQESGIYWVMLTVQLERGKWAEISLVPLNLTIYHRDDSSPITTSGAYYLRGNSTLSVTYMDGNSGSGSLTSFSFVHLKGNNCTAVGGGHSHMAYTGYKASEGLLRFSRQVSTDYGDMYNSDREVFTITVPGAYLVSVRGDPYENYTLQLDLYRNNVSVFSYFAELGYCSGQTAIFHLDASDVLFLRANDYRVVEPDTMVSVALAYRYRYLHG